MSFYFTLPATKDIKLGVVLDKLNNPDVTLRNDEEGYVVFYAPGQSLRGVMLYGQSDSYEIGLNAFTTRFDVELTRDVTAAIASLLDCPVQPEDSPSEISADDVITYCDEAWIAARLGEARFVMGDRTDQSADDPITLFGYARPFAVTRDLVNRHTGKGHAIAAAFELIMKDAMELQDIEHREDIFVPQLMEIAQKPAQSKDVLGRLLSRSEDTAEPTIAFVLTEHVRTLTPLLADHANMVAILGSDDLPYRQVPAADVVKAAQASGAREFCIGVFDLTLSGDDYQALYQHGTPM